MATGQIEMMCQFIKQEAKEKVNELRLKGQHEANLEASTMVHNAKIKIQSEVKEKEKQIKTMQRVKVTRAEAQVRVEKMKVREGLLDGVKSDAMKALQNVTNDKAKYETMLTDLIVQGLIKMNEPKVEVVVREADKALAEKVCPAATKKYIEVMQKEVGQTPNCSLTVNPDGKFLPPAADGSGKKSCAGGVKLYAQQGRIVCDNTLDARMETAFDELMPKVRSTLFTTKV